MGTDVNEIADGSARQSSSHPLIGPEPALCISAKVAWMKPCDFEDISVSRILHFVQVA